MADETQNAPVTYKVFVGNLSYSTDSDTLKQKFSEAGPVVTASIITRGRNPPRPVGYGFIEFANEEHANQAVKTFNKFELDGRAINVEIAKARQPRQEGDSAPPRRNFRRRNFRRRRVSQSEAPTAAEGEGQAQGQPVQGEGQAPRNRRRRQPRRPRNDSGSAPQESQPRRQRSGVNNRRRRTDEETNQEDQTAQPQYEAPRRRGPRRFGRFRRGPSRPRNPDDEVPSKTMLFVANLPYSLDDEALKSEFEKLSIKVNSAHVVYDRNQRSKGFGFVECIDEEQQKNASVKMDGQEINGRSILVKIARASSERKNQPEAPAS